MHALQEIREDSHLLAARGHELKPDQVLAAVFVTPAHGGRALERWPVWILDAVLRQEEVDRDQLSHAKRLLAADPGTATAHILGFCE